MPIFRSLRTRRAEREKLNQKALAARAAAEEAERYRKLRGNDSISESVEYVNQSDDDDFKLDESLEMTLSPDGIPILSKKPQTMGARLRHFLTLIFGIVAIVDAFVFLFLVPFIVAPSISVVLAQFNDTPVVCAVSKIETFTGVSNCSAWASCKIGCTSPALKCTQVSVNYKTAETPHEFETAEQRRILSSGELRGWQWNMTEARLFVNNEGCGYLPTVNCSAFDKEFAVEGKSFWCHNSNRDPIRVITKFSSSENFFILVTSSAGPLGLFLVCVTLLFCLNCKCSKTTDESNQREDGKQAEEQGGDATRKSRETLASGEMMEEDASISARVDRATANSKAIPGPSGVPPAYEFPPLYAVASASDGKPKMAELGSKQNSSMTSSARSSAGTRIEVRSPPGNDDDDIEPRTPPPLFKLPAIVTSKPTTPLGVCES